MEINKFLIHSKAKWILTKDNRHGNQEQGTEDIDRSNTNLKTILD